MQTQDLSILKISYARYHLFPQTLRLGCVPFKILAGHLSKTSIIMLYAVDRENFAVK